MKKYSTLLILGATLLLCCTQPVFAATQLATNTLGDLVLSDANGKVIKNLSPGHVGEIIHDGDSSFKISYGKDLQGNLTAIIYSSPANAPINLAYQGKNVVLSKDAVLTLIFDSNGAILQSGILGQVTVENESMPPSSYLRISNSGTVMAATAPVTPIPSTPTQIPLDNNSPAAPASDLSQNLSNSPEAGAPIDNHSTQSGNNYYGYVPGPNMNANSYGSAIFGLPNGHFDTFASTNDYGYQDGRQVGYPTYLNRMVNPKLEDALNRAQMPYRPRLNPSAITPVTP